MSISRYTRPFPHDRVTVRKDPVVGWYLFCPCCPCTLYPYVNQQWAVWAAKHHADREHSL